MVRNVPQPLRGLLVECIWKNRFNIKEVEFKDIVNRLSDALRNRSFIDKRNAIFSLIQIIWEYRYLTKQQYDRLTDATDVAYPLSSFRKKKKGQCPHVLASPVFVKAFIRLKGHGERLAEFLGLIKRIHSLSSRFIKVQLHSKLFFFLEKVTGISISNLEFIKMEDIYCRITFPFYWDTYRYFKRNNFSNAEVLGGLIEGLKNAERIEVAICFHQQIFSILKSAKLPKEYKKVVLTAEKDVINYYGLNK